MGFFDKAKSSVSGLDPTGGGMGGLDFVGDALGFGMGGDIKKAARQQIKADRRAMGLLREDLAPFRNLMSPEQMQAGVSLATDPQAQLDFLQNNPLFANLMQQSQEGIFANQAARGKLASGGTQEALQNSFLAQGQELINQQVNRFNPLLTNMQNAATQSATGSANLLSGMGASRSAGTIGAANADQQAMQNLIRLGSMAMGGMGGGAAGAGAAGGAMGTAPTQPTGGFFGSGGLGQGTSLNPDIWGQYMGGTP